jgi:putative N-acetylmannosamine-6-phosphate epimerase
VTDWASFCLNLFALLGKLLPPQPLHQTHIVVAAAAAAAAAGCIGYGTTTMELFMA